MAWIGCNGGGKKLTLVGTFSGSAPSRPTGSANTNVRAYSNSTITGEFPSTNPEDYVIEITGMGCVSVNNSYNRSGGSGSVSASVSVKSVTEDTMVISNTGIYVSTNGDSTSYFDGAYATFSGNVYYKG